MGQYLWGKGQNFFWADVKELDYPAQRLEQAVFFW
jgi:hypothetical protein